MHPYLSKLQDFLHYEISQADPNIPITCNIVTIEPVQSFYKITLKPTNKIKVLIKEEEKILIQNIVATVVEVTEEHLVVTSKCFIKVKGLVTITRLECNLEKILKRLNNYIKKNQALPDCINDFKPENGPLEGAYNRITTKYDKNKSKNKDIQTSHIDINACKQEHVNNVVSDVEFSNINFFDNGLNISQKKAIENVLENKSFKILGPPGTGKTRTIKEIVFQLLSKNKKVLVCGPSNTSIDNILYQFIMCQHNFYIVTKKQIKFFRLGSSIKCFQGFEQYNLNIMAENQIDFLIEEINDLQIKKNKNYQKLDAKKNKSNATKSNSNINNNTKYKNSIKEIYYTNKNIQELNNEKNQRLKDFNKKMISIANIIFSTLFSSSKINNVVFDYVIVDECCQALEVETFLNIVNGKNFILAGDPYQLGAVVKSKKHYSFFERINIETLLLNEQYRMPENLIKFSNSYFYNDQIVSIHKKAELNLFNEGNMIFVDTFDAYYVESNAEKSKTNLEEVNIIINFLEYLQLNHKELSIGIISPYLAQVELITEKIEKIKLNIKANTVDSFQGQEKDVLIISLVRSNDESEIGFLNEIRRTNVAITRCKMGLFVVGNSATFEKCKFYREFIDFLYANAFCIDPENFKKLCIL
ncbi:hypothetical protein COBT_001077 [Conglomerata obtusa]